MSRRQVADALQRKFDELVAQLFAQGTVTALAGTNVTVQVDDGALTVPRLASYTPKVGDRVWLVGPPGAWVCAGTITIA